MCVIQYYNQKKRDRAKSFLEVTQNITENFNANIKNDANNTEF